MQLPGLVQMRNCTLTDKPLAEAVAAGLTKMYKVPATVPPRHIPARPDEDFDLLVGEMVVRFLEKTEVLIKIRRLDIQHKIEHGAGFLPEKIRKEIDDMLLGCD